MPQEMKENIKALGNDFANKASRQKLHALINSYLYKNKTASDTSRLSV